MPNAQVAIGCKICARPCALVGDEIPEDELCPWCRAAKSPAVMRLWLEDQIKQGLFQREEMPTKPDLGNRK